VAVGPGTPLSSLLTGVLGIQPYPVRIEVIAWLIYLVPMVMVVSRNPSKPHGHPDRLSGAPEQQRTQNEEPAQQCVPTEST
jgi:high-affinity iron transporter